MPLHRVCCASLCGVCLALAVSRAEQQVMLSSGGWNASVLGSQVQSQDARTELRDGNLRVTTGRSAEWPGVTIRAPQDAWNLLPYIYLAADLRNPADRDVTVFCRVDNPGADGKDHCLTGQVQLPAGQTRTLTIPLTAKTPAALRSQLFGMRGYPGLWNDQQGIDLRQVTQLLFFVHRPTEEHIFEVLEVRAAGDRGPEPPNRPEELFPLIDRFGQYRHKQWPGKTASEADMERQRSAEEADLRANPEPPDWDAYGGWQAGPQLPATGRFHTQQLNGCWWLVDPEGHLFWSHGVDCVGWNNGSTPITDRQHWFAELPESDSPLARFYGRGNWAPHNYYEGKGEYQTFSFGGANLWRKYGDDWQHTFAMLCHQRLRSWSINTIANWSDASICRLRKTPYTANVGFESVPIAGSEGYWGKFPDVFDPSFAERLRRGMAGHRGGAIGDPWCVGYFVSNELSWGDETSLAVATLASPAKQAAKQAFVKDLQAKYRAIEELNRAWSTTHASWDDVLQSTTPPDTRRAHDDLATFYTKVAEQYFRTCRDVVKEYDPQGLYLGCRFAWANERAVRAAAKYCDVVSFNRYALSVADLSLPEGVDRPIVIGEFHFGALDRGMFHTGLVPVESQQRRAQAYQDYVRGALSHPAIVGTHWFQYSDQATTGRGDGENYQIGFVDICDTPYPETIAACREVGRQLYTYRSQQCRDRTAAAR